ncbi:MAG: hypothetical protein KAI17_08755, partial [Thiotrichaceae bacterium]|nr:hypothetical protein [Thiotrichaceae bacterium]
PPQNIATNPIVEPVIQVDSEEQVVVEETAEESSENLKYLVQSHVKDTIASKTGTTYNIESEIKSANSDIANTSFSQNAHEVRDINLAQLQALNDQLSNQAKLSIYLDSDHEFDSQEEARLFQKIDELNDQISFNESGDNEEAQIKAQVVLGSSISLTAGFVSWVLRGGSLLASLMSTVPLLNKFDPLPILKTKSNKDKAKEKDDDEESSEDESFDEVDELLKHIEAEDNASDKH